MEVDKSNIKGHVIVVMAPMGSGKGTLIHRALEQYPEMYQTVSCTSRDMRPGEVDGKHYHYISPEEFAQKIEKGDFLEWAEFAGNRYGTPKSEIIPKLAEEKVVIVEVDLQGVESLMELLTHEHMTIVYVEAGGWDVLRARAEARAPMTEESIQARHERYLIEKQSKPMADVIINNSEDVEIAYAEFVQVIEDAYSKFKS